MRKYLFLAVVALIGITSSGCGIFDDDDDDDQARANAAFQARASASGSD
jgi:hypothetical protein